MLEFRSEAVHVQVLAPSIGADATATTATILTQDALRMVGTLCAAFEPRRQALLDARRVRAVALDAGDVPTFVEDDPAVHDPHWKCAPIPDDVQDRRVEITGPVDRKMVINGLNSGASVYMADFEDSTSPTWTNVVEGQLNLKDAVAGTISYASGSKQYKLKARTATLFVRPRGWHLNEGHVLVNGKPASGGIFDFALYLFHNHQNLAAKGTRPYYYLPKLENRLEARLWNDVIVAAESYLGLDVGTVRATVLLETITAAFEMEEILYELRDHMLGLNCGRWDYLFSYIKKFKMHPDKVTPDRAHLTMTAPLMTAYVKRLVHLCHKRGTFAMGGMSAAIPIKDDPERNAAALRAVELDKLREVQGGHDGTWVAHPALVPVAKSVFDAHMVTPNQIRSHHGTDGAYVTEADLLELPKIPTSIAVTSPALAKGVGIVVSYTEAWLRGVGCIPLHNAMEDAATAEISRAQIWSWRVHRVRTSDDNQEITSERVANLVREFVANKQQQQQQQPKGADNNKWALAGKLVEHMLNKDELDDFLTSVCYPHIMTTHEVAAESHGDRDDVSSKL